MSTFHNFTINFDVTIRRRLSWIPVNIISPLRLNQFLLSVRCLHLTDFFMHCRVALHSKFLMRYTTLQVKTCRAYDCSAFITSISACWNLEWIPLAKDLLMCSEDFWESVLNVPVTQSLHVKLHFQPLPCCRENEPLGFWNFTEMGLGSFKISHSQAYQEFLLTNSVGVTLKTANITRL